MQNKEFVRGLLDFIKISATPFHAVQSMVEILQAAGFQRLLETERWLLQKEPAGGRYFVTRNDSSIIAFELNQPLPEHGIHMVGAHTDSPCLKVKPNPEIIKNAYVQLGVEVYGGVLLNPWFDRDLSLAGRVNYLNAEHQIEMQLIDWQKAIAVIPSLAIHLDRDANDHRNINKQQHLAPVLMPLPAAGDDVSFQALLLELLNDQLPDEASKAITVLDYELSFYDVQAPAMVGLNDDFIAGARLDNLLSCYTGLMALIDHPGECNALLVCNDHEEVGSVSAAGAQGTFLRSTLERLCDNDEDVSRMLARRICSNFKLPHPTSIFWSFAGSQIPF